MKLDGKSGLLPRVGEIIRIESKFGMPGSGVYKVEGCVDTMLMIAAGDVQTWASLEMVKIVARNLPEPESWLPIEIEILRHQVAACDCVDCQALLTSKLVALAKQEASDLPSLRIVH